MRVAIAGAGNVGRSIANELLGNDHEVLLIDKDSKAIKADSAPKAEWLLQDACELSSLEEAALDRCDVMIAATGDDKVNLVVSLLAKTEFGVPRVVARVVMGWPLFLLCLWLSWMVIKSARDRQKALEAAEETNPAAVQEPDESVASTADDEPEAR